MAWRGSLSILIRLLHSGPFLDWLSLFYRSVEQFQSHIIFTYNKTVLYYK